jgi:hypothetical protein
MGKALIQTVNQSSQTVAENSIINLGSVIRRYGCNLRLNGNAVEVNGEGYYKVDCNVTLEPTATGAVTVAIYKNGVPLTGATASGSVSTAGNPVTLPIQTTIKEGCCCDGGTALTVVLVEGASTVTNVALRVEKA